jgi:hypothetical protein
MLFSDLFQWSPLQFVPHLALHQDVLAALADRGFLVLVPSVASALSRLALTSIIAAHTFMGRGL